MHPMNGYEQLVRVYYPNKITSVIAKRMQLLEKSLGIETLITKDFTMSKPILTNTSDENRIRIKFTYTNWKGKTSLRRASFEQLLYGSNEWHTEPQWLLYGWDENKQDYRTFALKNMTDIQVLDG